MLASNTSGRGEQRSDARGDSTATRSSFSRPGGGRWYGFCACSEGFNESVPIVLAAAVAPSLQDCRTLSQPGNVTGITSLNQEVAPKRLQLLREVLPSVANVALLLNPSVPAFAEATERASRAAAEAQACSYKSYTPAAR